MKILIIEPFFTGSHARWATEFKAASRHEVDILKLEGRSWKWRMRGGAVTLARVFREGGYSPDLILATDMLDLATFLSLTRDLTALIPTAVYFHENQLCYPWSPREKDSESKRRQYGFINFTTALSADRVFFNSRFHMEAFLSELDVFLKGFPDHNEAPATEKIREKSSVLYLGMDLDSLDGAAAKAPADCAQEKNPPPLILWNHRWEYDKGPEDFFKMLYLLMDKGLPFEVAILGEHFEKIPDLFKEAKELLGERIIHFGYLENYAEYARWLKRADILPVTSTHDFFGSSVIEAIYAGVTPLLPKRLAYPEHIPVELHERYFYDGFDDLVRRMEVNLRSDSPPASNEVLREHVARYGWSAMISIYDEEVEDVVDSY